jgi:intracellular sulfur oxidation DsrE/DsrF family protein
VAESDAQFAQRAGLLLPTSGFSGSFRYARFGAAGSTIPALQQRGVVFMACHNAVWEQTAKLLEKGINPDRRSHEEIAAELTNHLIQGVVLTPGIVGTIPELQKAGFHYAK